MDGIRFNILGAKNAGDAQRNRYYYDIEIGGVREHISSRIHHRETLKNGHVRLYFTPQPEHANKTITLIAYNSEQELRKEMKVVEAISDIGPHSFHDTLDDAAIDFGEQYNGMSIRAEREIGTLLYQKVISNNDVKYLYSIPYMGTEGFVDPNNAEKLSNGEVLVGTIHTHGTDGNNEPKGIDEKEGIRYGDNFPSDNDIDEADKNFSSNSSFKAEYTVVPNGTLYKYVHST